MNKFWKFVKDEVSSDKSELILEGVVASESWWGDEVTPKAFRDELAKYPGPISVRINSPGGDVWAGVSIYNALSEHEGEVTVKVDGIAASIASIIAMAGDKIIMLPGSMMMVHQPWTMAAGNKDELANVITMLEKTGESLVDIYVARTRKSKDEIVALLEAETWMTAEDAVELGFATEAQPAKTTISDSIKNALNYASVVNSAVLQPVMSMKARKNVSDVATPVTEADKQEPEAPVEEETETTEIVEPVVPANNQSTKGVEMTEAQKKAQAEKDALAASQVIEPKNQATVDAKATPTVEMYLKSQASVEDFAEVLRANAGKSFKEVKDSWKEALVKNGLTDADYFRLPDPVITSIEDAVKASGIYNALNHTGLDVFKVTWDDTDEDADTSRAGGHQKGDTKDEQILDFENRVIRAQFIYKYLVLDKETIRENRSTGALVRFVLNELPIRIVREMERAAIIGDGRASGNKRHITSFIAVKADVEADNLFATAYTPGVGESRYESLVRALELIEAEGAVYLIHKKGFLTDLRLETNVNGGYIFAPGTDVAAAMGFDGAFKPTWFNDTTDPDYDAYIVVLSAYKTVGDNSIESFTNFKLETNENEFLQEIYKGGGLSARLAAVGIESTNS